MNFEPLPLLFDWEKDDTTTLERPDGSPIGDDSPVAKAWLEGGLDARTWCLNSFWPAKCFALAAHAGYGPSHVVGFSLVVEGGGQFVCLCTLAEAMRGKGGHGQPGVRAWLRGKLRSTTERPKRSASVVVATSLAKVRAIVLGSFLTQHGATPGARARIATGIADLEGHITRDLANVQEEQDLS